MFIIDVLVFYIEKIYDNGKINNRRSFSSNDPISRNLFETYYEQTQADDIGALLGSLQLLEDGKPADPALWQDWLKSSESVIFSSIYHV